MPRARMAAFLAALTLAALSWLGPGEAVSAPPTGSVTTAPASTASSAAVGAAREDHDQAVVELLIIERRLETAERRLADAERAHETLQADLTRVEGERTRALRDLEGSRNRLGSRLRATYMAGGLGWLDLLFGSTDLRQLVQRATSLGRVLDSQATLLDQVEGAAARAAAAAKDLRAAHAAQAAAIAETRRLRDEEAAARAAQAGVVSRLGDRLATVEASARAARERMESINRDAQGPSAGSDSSSSPRPAASAPRTTRPPLSGAPRTSTPPGQTPPPGVGRQIECKVTAYALPGTTATGVKVRYGIIAVDPKVIPLGTRLYVPGYGEGIAADTGGDIKGTWIDVWLPSEAQARQWGVKHLTVTILD